MGQLVQPTVHLIGFTEAYVPGIKKYLEDTKQMDFWEDFETALASGISSGEALCSFYGKLCYKSLVVGKNANISKTRSVKANLESCFDTGHGSIFEHFQLNYVVTNCSRVYTHEQVRHRVGWAYSQTSGRYCRLDSIDLVWDPILDPVKDLWLGGLRTIENLVYLTECKLGLRKPNTEAPNAAPETWLEAVQQELLAMKHTTAPRGPSVEHLKWVPDDTFDFEKRKKITSAIRRIAPNGQSNEIGMSCNIRALRQVVQVRTARHAETEIRNIFAQVFHVTAAKFPLMFHRAKTRIYDGLPEVYGMKTQPFEMTPDDPKALELFETGALRAELAKRSD